MANKSDLSCDENASLDKDMMDNFKTMQIDDEWDELHQKIQSIRETGPMTITEFLVCVGLDPNRPYFKQLCAKTTKKLHPSTRKNSSGREFRDAVSKYFDELTANSHSSTIAFPHSSSSSQSLETVLCEWLLDNRSDLRGRGISGIYLSKSNPVGIIIDAYSDCTVSNTDILQMLMKDYKIVETLKAMNESDLVVESRSLSTPLSVVSSPVCIKAATMGTATLVNYRGAIIALTCCHVI